MQQIKLLQQTQNKFGDTQARLFLEDCPSPKKKRIEHLEMIEPWLEDHDPNPFLNQHSKQIKVRKQSPSIKRQASLTLAKNNWRSIEKVVLNRESKVLPVMDVGKFNSIRKLYLSEPKKQQKTESHAFTQRSESRRTANNDLILPSVRRELSIERKIFLMKNMSDNSSASPSPSKTGKLRSIINDARF